MSAITPRWRAMRTAPKDGTYILLAYPSFSDSGEVFVGHARWVDVPHTGLVEKRIIDSGYRDEALPLEIPPTPHDPHWEVAYVAVTQHGGRWYQGLSYGPSSVTIRNPIAWTPCPKPPKARKS